MAANFDLNVLIDRNPVGKIYISNNLNIGDVIIKIFISFKDQLKIKSEPSNMVNSPPHNSELSFLILGPNNRFMRSFNLSQIEEFRSIKLSAPIQWTGKLIGEENSINIYDIAYDKMQYIHIFTSLLDWSKNLLNYEKMHHQALLNHYNFGITKDISYRQNNQRLRRDLANKLNKFLIMKSSSSLIVENENDVNNSIKLYNSTKYSDKSSVVNNQMTYYSPDTSRSSFYSSDEINDKPSDECNDKSLDSNSSTKYIDNAQSGGISAKYKENIDTTKYKENVDTTKYNHRSSLQLFSGSNHNETSLSGHDVIMRLVKAGIAKDALGQMYEDL